MLTRSSFTLRTVSITTGSETRSAALPRRPDKHPDRAIRQHAPARGLGLPSASHLRARRVEFPCGGRRSLCVVVTRRATAEEVLRNMGLGSARPPLATGHFPPQPSLDAQHLGTGKVLFASGEQVVPTSTV